MPGPSTQAAVNQTATSHSNPSTSRNENTPGIANLNRAEHASRAESDSNTDRGKALATLARDTKSKIDEFVHEFRGKLLKLSTDSKEDFQKILLVANFYCYYEPSSNGTVHTHNVALAKKRTVWNTFYLEEFSRLDLPADGDEGLFSEDTVEQIISSGDGEDCPTWAKPMRDKCRVLSLLYRSVSAERKADLQRKTDEYNKYHSARLAVAGAVDCDIQATSTTSSATLAGVLDCSDQAKKRERILNDFSKEMKTWVSSLSIYILFCFC